MSSWLPISQDSDFSLQNLPYGVFSTEQLSSPRAGVAVGNSVLDIKVLAQRGVFDDLGFDTGTLAHETLNEYAALGRPVHRRVRRHIQEILRSDTSLGHVLRDNEPLRREAVVPLKEVTMHLPMSVAEYTDFFCTPHHARNCLEVVGAGAALPPGFFRFPLGYGGRASSVVVSGTPVRRPKGQSIVGGEAVFGPCQALDFEAEFAAFVARGNELGTSIPVEEAKDYIFGFVILNDWSARDFQRAEAGPVGPLVGKNFCTSISPWVVTPDALEAFRGKPVNPGPLLPYLDQGDGDTVFDIPIDVQIQVGETRYQFSRCNTKNTCFSFSQMLAHQTSGGCPARTGDLFASGTLSGETRAELGCLFEASSGGRNPCQIAQSGPEGGSGSGSTIKRAWLEDGDIVHMSARVKSPDGTGYVGFGSCSGQVVKGT